MTASGADRRQGCPKGVKLLVSGWESGKIASLASDPEFRNFDKQSFPHMGVNGTDRTE